MICILDGAKHTACDSDPHPSKQLPRLPGRPPVQNVGAILEPKGSRRSASCHRLKKTLWSDSHICVIVDLCLFMELVMSRLTIDLTDQQHQSLKALAALTGKTIKQYALEHSSEERRVGKECVSKCRSRRSTYH